MSNFQYTEEQQKIVDRVFNMINGVEPKLNLIVSAQGGTGKTTMAAHLICDLIKAGHNVAAGIYTGKAAGVMREKVYNTLNELNIKTTSDILKIDTLSKLTQTSKVIATTANGDVKFDTHWICPESFKYEILIIDELSMVPSYMYEWWIRTKALVIGMGDKCQIPEVNTGENEQLFNRIKTDLHLGTVQHRAKYGVSVLGLQNAQVMVLTKCLRSTGDITNLCNDLRDFSLNKNQQRTLLKKWAKKSENIEYSTDINDIPTDIDNWQIISYTNKTCEKINQQYAIGTDYPDLNDKVLVGSNVNNLQIYNGEIYKFKDLIDKSIKNGNLSVVWRFNDQLPRANSKNVIEQACYNIYINEMKRAAERTRYYLSMLEQNIYTQNIVTDEGIKQKFIDIIKQKKEIISNESASEELLDALAIMSNINSDLLVEIQKNAVMPKTTQFVNIRFGYCCTVHKSQGSEYDNVCYILDSKYDKPLLYTACSRAKHKLKIIDLTS